MLPSPPPTTSPIGRANTRELMPRLGLRSRSYISPQISVLFPKTYGRPNMRSLFSSQKTTLKLLGSAGNNDKGTSGGVSDEDRKMRADMV